MNFITSITTNYRASIISQNLKAWIKPKNRCLDVGCGNGVVSVYLSKSLNIHITGCDVLNYLKYKIPFKKMSSANKIPFPDHSFDIAMICDVLHHMSYKNQVNVLKESFRVAERVLVFEEEPTLSARMFDYILNKIHNPQMDIPLSYRSSKQWIQLFHKLGYKHKFKKVKKNFWYPFSHIAFHLETANIKRNEKKS